CILNARVQLGDSIAAGDQAKALLERAAEAGDEVESHAADDPGEAITAFRRWQAAWLDQHAAEDDGSYAYSRALVHADLGERERALSELERAADRRSLVLLSMNVEPRFDALRENPRFRALVSRMALE
ncbi:MAG: hypothetical protein J4A00_07355, partial [Gammaproteobacteria bacterium]|nr:hypothetical protein [Gammaproteobacteria bacterium]